MTEEFSKKDLTKKSENFSNWYIDVILKTKLADYGPARGSMIIRPYGYALWERVQNYFNAIIKADGVENAYFPLLIPIKLLQKEKDHIKGFSPELAVVTMGGGEELEEPLAIRPTSETIIYSMFAKWVSSWRDLPVKINQWCNVVRWEKRTLPFIRTTEFLWQEGHTLHATYEEAKDMSLKALHWYKNLYKDMYALPVLIGLKSESEKFAGAKHTYTVEALVSDGKMIQGATSHVLSDHFAKSFDISYQDKNGETAVPTPTSWGLSTRSLGTAIMVHGDDNGLVLPPSIAPKKVVIVPVFGKKDSEVINFCFKVKEIIDECKSEYSGSVEVWGSKEHSFGWKANEAELIGVPLSIPIGPKEMGGEVPINISYRLGELKNVKVENIDNLGQVVEEMLNNMQDVLYKRASEFLNKNTFSVDSYKEFKDIMNTTKGLIKAFWCENPECETKIKQETKATTRLLPLDAKEENGKCVYCGELAKHRWYFAQAY